ncbi:DHA14-like major facilitator [Podospora aff. communis PSN243]|uniref:DHA14-like major facilitator n=1 Tax=Podospora aff. communis PSN243 TaxID=3040156 RepID=A0AAV9GCK0_9PEZI|nr:DHA14-like major facilitator [Podospora aff. communis PSN243]
MEEKLAVPAAQTLPESEAATIAATSVVGDEKSDVEAAPAADTAAGEPEKSEELARQATAASKTGQSIRPTATREDGTEYPSGMKLGLITLALCLSVFLMALDNSIIATAIPEITNEFTSLPDVGWYGSAYLLTTAALQLLFGRFYTFFSIKLIYLIAIFIFEVGSLICAVAQNSVTLIVGRAVAGVGSAAVFSGALIILAYSVPLAKRPIYSGMIGSMYGIASVSGPLLGGVFTDKVTWRWCFYINLPIGAITIAVIAIFFPDPHREITNNDTMWQRIKRFDPFGTVVFMPAIICLLLALQWGGTEYAWNSWRIILLFVFFGVLIIIFLFIQHKQQDLGTVPPRIFFKRSVWASGFYSFCLGAAFLGSVYYLPIWFQAVKGASAVDSGIMNLPMLISCVLFSIFAGAAVSTWGYYTPFMLAGVVFVSVGYGLITTFQPDTGRGAWIGYQILAGTGIGLGMQQPLMAVQTVLAIEDVPTGTAIIVFMQTLGGALFVSVAQNVFTNKLVEYIGSYVPGIPNPLFILGVGATKVQTVVDPAFLPGVTQAYNDALTQTFIVFTALSVLSIVGAAFTEWKSVKGKQVEMAIA